jgi:N-acetylneuraminic acid mutarotase
MIIWGGSDGGVLNTGARYLPVADTWRAVSTNGAPTARQDHTAVWTGTHLLVWGGRAGATEYNTGARYSPTSGKWCPITTTSAPGARYDHGAVWTGSEMLIWGGYDGANCLDTIKGYTPPVILYLYLKP